jgi:hypothetical protein
VKLRMIAALATVALIGAGCSNGAAEHGSTATPAATQTKAVRFARCMRANGVRKFPDPDASGALTIDGVVNRSSLHPDSPAWKQAIDACKDLEPAGFTGHKRSAEQQDAAIQFAQCMRDNGFKDFPDPAPDAPLIDTTRIPSAAGRGARSIPGFDAAAHKCGAALADELGLRSQ